MNEKTTTIGCLFMGMLGALTFLISDYIMIYGDPTPLSNKVRFLTVGVSQIPGWRNNLAMLISFPGTVLFAIGLFHLETLIINKTNKTIYHYLNIIGLTPWLLLHFLFIILFYTFHFMMTNGYQEVAVPVAEEIYTHFSWIILVCFLFMVPPFVYYLWLTIRGQTIINRYMVLFHIGVFIIILSGIYSVLPESGFKRGFKNALINQSMFLYFGSLIIYFLFSKNRKKTKG